MQQRIHKIAADSAVLHSVVCVPFTDGIRVILFVVVSWRSCGGPHI